MPAKSIPRKKVQAGLGRPARLLRAGLGRSPIVLVLAPRGDQQRGARLDLDRPIRWSAGRSSRGPTNLLVVASLPRPGLPAKGIIRVPLVYPNCRLHVHGTREVTAAQLFHEEGQLIRNQWTRGKMEGPRSAVLGAATT